MWTFPNVISDATPNKRVIDDEHDDRSDDGDEQTVNVEARYSMSTHKTENPATDYRSYDPQYDVQENAFTSLIHNLAADKPCDQAQDNPSEK